MAVLYIFETLFYFIGNRKDKKRLMLASLFMNTSRLMKYFLLNLGACCVLWPELDNDDDGEQPEGFHD